MTPDVADPGTSMSQRLPVRNEADVHGAVMLCYSLLGRTQVGNIVSTEMATVISELGMNIVKYAPQGGSLWLQLHAEGRGWMEVLAQDQGPGIADLGRALQEHYSTTGTLGLGLPGVRRMVDKFDISSSADTGTTVRVRKWLGGAPSSPQGNPPASARRAESPAPVGPRPEAANPTALDVASVNRPSIGERRSGDATLAIALGNGALLGLIDVLGHGDDAHALASVCVQWITDYVKVQPEAALEALLGALHLAIKGQRGIAISLVRARPHGVDVAGVGNTIAYAVGNTVQSVSAQPGVLGANMPRLRLQTLALDPGDLMLLTSDGISERIDSSALLSMRHYPVVRSAAEVLRRYGKLHDDASCLVYRHGTSAPADARGGHAG